MESTIDEFFGWETSYVAWNDKGEKYEEIKGQLSGLLSRFDETLTEEQKMMVKELGLYYSRLSNEAERAAYKAGFKRGLNLAMEAVEH